MSYAWIITEDHIAGPGEECAVGTHGPMLAPPETWNEEWHRQHGAKTFRMKEEDGDEIAYVGLFTALSPDRVTGFEPLDDFGNPDAGCTTIEYFENGEWVEL